MSARHPSASHPSDDLAAAGITLERRGGARLGGALTAGERQFYRWILRSFGAGTLPGPDALADAASELELEVEPALERLRRLDLRPDSGNPATAAARS